MRKAVASPGQVRHHSLLKQRSRSVKNTLRASVAHQILGNESARWVLLSIIQFNVNSSTLRWRITRDDNSNPIW